MRKLIGQEEEAQCEDRCSEEQNSMVTEKTGGESLTRVRVVREGKGVKAYVACHTCFTGRQVWPSTEEQDK